MKHYINKVKLLTLLSIISFSLSSCGDFLLIEPKTFVTEDNFWNEKNDVDQMVAGVYCMLQNSAIIERCIVWGEMRSDNLDEGLNVKNNEDLYFTLKETLKAKNKYTDWAQFYKTINAAQIVIERAPEVSEKDPTYTPSQVLATQAEMKAIKALCMFYLVRAFKDVPYPTHAVQSELDMEPMYAQNGDSIVRVLIADLEGCVGNALKKYPKDENRDHNSNYNRITQSAIYALLCDLCLWNGDYEKVVTYAEKVIDQKWMDFDEDYSTNVNMESGGRPVQFVWDGDIYPHMNGKHTGYPLYPCYSGQTYGSNFSSIFGEGNSFESVFELAFTPSSSGGNYISNSAVGGLYGKQNGAEMSEGPLYVYEGLMSDVKNKLYKVFDHAYDIRYYTSFQANSAWEKAIPTKYVSTSASVETAGGANALDTHMPFSVRYSGSSRSDANWIFYRLTDVMLMEAEALVEMGGKNLYELDENGDPVLDENGVRTIDDNLNRAFAIVWAINRRSLMTPNFNTTNATTTGLVLKQNKYESQEEMRELVMKERRRELLFEGKRWFDLLRYCHRNGNKTDYVRKYVPAKTDHPISGLFSNYESLYWPYNKTELKSNTVLKQKPYYGNSDDDDKDYESSSKK